MKRIAIKILILLALASANWNSTPPPAHTANVTWNS